MERSLLLALGPVLNLGDRLVSHDSPRSIALAKRTFQRCKLDRDLIYKYLEGNDSLDVIFELIDEFDQLRQGSPLDQQRFILSYSKLIALLNS